MHFHGNEIVDQLEARDFGPAFTRIEEVDGKLFITNDEYTSEVKFCPICGYSIPEVSSTCPETSKKSD